MPLSKPPVVVCHCRVVCPPEVSLCDDVTKPQPHLTVSVVDIRQLTRHVLVHLFRLTHTNMQVKVTGDFNGIPHRNLTEALMSPQKRKSKTSW